MKKVKTKILGHVYSLVGESEKVMKQAAQEVENQLQNVFEKYKDESTQTIYTIAALNIAEKLTLRELQSQADEEFVIEQVKRITTYLLENIN
ncbi:MAG: cell division protein ZapA [Candidatus Kapaibacteriales bacterium]